MVLERNIKKILLFFIISRLILTGVGVLAFEYGPPLCENRMHGDSGNKIIDVLVRWDAGWYINLNTRSELARFLSSPGSRQFQTDT